MRGALFVAVLGIAMFTVGVPSASAQEPPTPATKADCKNGGWRDFADDQGRPFKNQGECIVFVMRALFEAPVSHPVGIAGTDVIAADLDRDGRLDLAVSAFAQHVAVLLNNGDGTFAAAATYEAGRNPASLATGDFDSDSAPDLAVANSDGVAVLRNNGNGTFASPVTYAFAEAGVVAVGNFDGDGTPDLAVAAFQGKLVFVLLNNGDGTFGPAASYPTGFLLNDVATADFDGDGALDLAVSDSTGNTGIVSVLSNVGDGTFAAAVHYDPGIPFGEVTHGVAAIDLNHDGAPDLAVTSTPDLVSVLVNNGDGTFATATTFTVGASPNALAAGDVDRDGAPDLVTANLDSNDVSVLLNKGNATFESGGTYRVGTQPTSVAIADLDGDTQSDLAVTSFNTSDLSVLLHR